MVRGNTALETRKFGRRIHVEVDRNDIQVGDVVFFDDGGLYCRCVVRVCKKSIQVSQPKGFHPKTKRVLRENVKEVWRWHKKA